MGAELPLPSKGRTAIPSPPPPPPEASMQSPAAPRGDGRLFMLPRLPLGDKACLNVWDGFQTLTQIQAL